MRQISEPDWKVFRQLHPVALERFCEQVLAEVGQLAADTAQSAHARYLAVYRLMEQRDRELGDTFNDKRRSTAFVQIACIRARGLLTEEEFARFSPETRAVVALFLAAGQDSG
jgi:hypothetical protein